MQEKGREKMQTQTSNGKGSKKNSGGAPPPGDRKVYKLVVPVKPTDDEIRAAKDALLGSLRARDNQIARMKADAKDHRATITKTETMIDEQVSTANGEKVEREIDVYDHSDFSLKTVFTRRADTDDVVHDRVMTLAELQTSLPAAETKPKGAKAKEDDSGIVDDDYGKTNAERAAAAKAKKDAEK